MAPEPQQYEEFVDQEIAAAYDRLSFIRPGARDLREAKPSLFVRSGARYWLPAGALLILAMLIVWPILTPSKLVAVAVDNIPDLVIKNLHFTGLDTKNEPYSLTADKATRPSNLHDIYDFDNPQGEITLANGSWISGKAQYGRFSQETHRLWLGGNVQIFQDKGYQFTTDEAQIDLNGNNAWGQRPVLIQGGFGEIRGQGFRMMDSGKVMVITGPAHASLQLHPASSSDKPSGAAP